jgi:hypothetical protein
MSNLQIYLTFGVPGLTILIVFGIVLDFLQFRALHAKFDEADAREAQRQAKLDIR